jgi:hypothetical protein
VKDGGKHAKSSINFYHRMLSRVANQKFGPDRSQFARATLPNLEVFKFVDKAANRLAVDERLKIRV